jgi:hypothetical protein
MGRLIPAGTGVPRYNKMDSLTDEPEETPETLPGPEVAPEAVA